MRRCSSGTRWDGSGKALLTLHGGYAVNIICTSSTVWALSFTLETRLNPLVARSIQFFLGVPRAEVSSFVITEARALTIPILRGRGILRHFFRLLTRHHDHTLVATICRRAPSRVHKILMANRDTILTRFAPPFESPAPLWTNNWANIPTLVPVIGKNSALNQTTLRQLTLSMLDNAPAGITAVYMDGSTNDLSSTTAFVIPSLKVEKSFLLAHKTSLTNTELFSILQAILSIAQKTETIISGL